MKIYMFIFSLLIIGCDSFPLRMDEKFSFAGGLDSLRSKLAHSSWSVVPCEKIGPGATADGEPAGTLLEKGNSSELLCAHKLYPTEVVNGSLSTKYTADIKAIFLFKAGNDRVEFETWVARGSTEVLKDANQEIRSLVR